MYSCVSACVGVSFFTSQDCMFLSCQGCYEKVEEWLDDNKHLLGTIAMCVLVIQVRVCVCVCVHTDVHVMMLLQCD